MKSIFKDFKKDGVILVPSLISKKEIDSLYKTIIIFFKKYFAEDFSWCNENKKNVWNNFKFHESLIKARKKSPKKFGYIYDSIQLSHSAKKIMVSSKILNIVKLLSKQKIENFTCINSVIRFDMPNDNKNSVNWHYDAFPKSKNIYPKDGFTAQVFFHKTLINHGSPFFLLRSNFAETKQKLVKTKKNKSELYSVNKNYIKKFKKKQFIANVGDTAIFPMNLIHKSGKNKTSQARISGIFRYYSINNSTFLPLKDYVKPVK